MSRVAIIGGGIVGAAIAYELSRRPELTVILLERDEPAAGSTGAALGVLMGAISQKTRGRAWQLRQASLQRYQTLIDELQTLTGQAIPHNRQGIVLLHAATEANWPHWERLQALRQQQGWPLELWSRSQLEACCPQVAIAPNNLDGAIYSPADGQVDPTALTEALIAAAVAQGARCYCGTTVTAIATEAVAGPQRVTGLQAGEQSLACDWLVIAAGLGSLPLTTQLQAPVNLRPVLGQALQVQLPQDLGRPEFQPVLSGEDVHLVPLGGGAYWVGATVEFPETAEGVRADPQRLHQLWQRAIAFYPALAQGEIVRTWSGQRPRPEGQSAPVIGPLAGYDNVLLATGHYRNGVLLAPATALAIATALAARSPADRFPAPTS